MSDRVKDFMSKINTTYKSRVAGLSTDASYGVKRFSSGVLSLDCSLGGGWPFGRLCIIAGNESTGKTLLSLKAAGSVSNYDRTTRLHKSLVPTANFEPCNVLFVDAEGTFDGIWARHHGWNDELNVVARPDYAEQAIDIVDFALRDNTFDLIVVDSIAALTPSKEVTESAEDWQMGLAARLVNKAMRKWSASLNKLAQEHKNGGPMLLCLNQIREKVGVMYGDPRVLPCGKGQLFAASTILWTRSAKITDDPETKSSGIAELGGVVKKNKTFTPGLEYAFKFMLTDVGDRSVGEVDNETMIVKFGKKYGLLNRDGGFGLEGFRRLTPSLGSSKSRKTIENKREQDIADKVGGFRMPSSGAFQNMKGDVSLDTILMDSKSTVGELMSIGRKDIMKITREAEGQDKDPSLVLTWDNMSSTVENQWVAIPMSVFIRLIENVND
jgi:recombination protein RecA